MPNEERFFQEFKKVRNRFRKFDSRFFIMNILNYINSPAKNNLERTKRHPWLCLLVVKWILIDDNFDKPRRPAPTMSETLDILNKAYKLMEFGRMPTEYENVDLWVRATLIQQLPYQLSVSVPHFFRQWILFAEQDPNSWIATTFRERVGITIQDFLLMGYGLITEFLTTANLVIKSDFFDLMAERLDRDSVDAFFASLSSNFEELRSTLLESEGNARRSIELLEQTPFLKTPLIELTHESDFACINTNVFFRCIEHFIYDELRRADAGRFMDKFGEPIFEKYVEKCLSHIGLSYVSAASILTFIQNEEKSADFVVSEREANIYIDTKGVEMANAGKNAFLSEVVRHRVKNSVIKAIEQTNRTKVFVEQGRIGELNPRDESFAIVVTFKELYLLNGRFFYEKIAKESIDRIHESIRPYEPIPPENMFFLSIENFDWLLGLVENGKTTITDALRMARNADADPSTMKFEFKMHLADHFNSHPTPSWLKERMDSVQTECLNIFGK